MDSSDGIQIVVLLLLIVLSAFFSSAETAMTTVNRIRIQSLTEQGNKRAQTLIKIIDNSGKMLSTVLIGNNIVNICASSLMTTFVIHRFGNIYVGAGTGILTLVVLIWGEIIPKTLAATHAEKFSLAYARIIYPLMVILTPVVFLVQRLANGFMLLLRIDPNARHNAMTEHELRTIVNVSEQDGVIENEEKQMIYNVFDFGDSSARDVMVPRIDMTFVDVESTYDELIEIFREDMHTRFPVYEETTDNVIGIINMKDLLLLDRTQPFTLRDHLRDVYFTYEHKSTVSLLLEMREASYNLAIVLDEYGATVGLVSLEDLLEEIVGEIRDEYDTEEEEDITEIVPRTEYLFLGSARIDDINEKLHLGLDSEDYDSIGGYIIEQMDSLPAEGQTVELANGIRFLVEHIDKNRVEKVRAYIPEDFYKDINEKDVGDRAHALKET